MKTVAFTGHRPPKIGGYDIDNPTAVWVREELAQAIHRAYLNGFYDFISGGAQGVDQIAAEEVIDLREQREEYSVITLTIARPFPSQAARWPEDVQDHYDQLLEQANEVVTVCDDPYAAWKMQRRNEWMVNQASVIVAVWDGSTGGTGNCIEYARGKRPIFVIDPKKQETFWIPLNGSK